ncbi:DUF1857 family protein [Geomonas sp. Red32]|uniref:AtaL-like protein n=1 Tax=Geomonas sp. Red32 TaxID=2912856 RepID=UPI00202CBFC4|nr:AtaL-like protein [Geomonas sp. Red32]MCM0082831.1 DUF1857 family protein [Geomonas sp. Red32]
MPMIVKTVQILVHAEYETLWKLLMDRLENPGRYLPGVTEARITERTDEWVVRDMKLHGEDVKERILVRPYDGELRHELVEHPQFTGFIVTKIVRTARQSPVAPLYLEYDLDLQTRSFKVQGAVPGEAEIMSGINTEMQRLKSRAEEMDGRG